MSLLQNALSYARSGLPIFPCFAQATTTDGVLHKAKSPRVPTGFKAATCDEQIISAWWRNWPDSMIGMPTGQASGIFAIDVDGPTGEKTLRTLEEVWGKLPPTRIVKTGRLENGWHIYFLYPTDIKLKSKDSLLGDHVDVKAFGGYIILPGSVHPSGRKYEVVVDEPIAKPPAWVIELAQDRNGHQKAPEGTKENQKESAPPKTDLQRYPVLRSLAASLRNKGQSPAEIFAALQITNKTLAEQTGKPPYDDKKLRDLAQWFESKPAGNATQQAQTNTAVQENSVMTLEAAVRNPVLIRWLIPGIPLGTLSVICGPPGNGKSTIIVDLVARGTRGLPWFDEIENTCEPFDVIMLCGEEDLDSMVVPRLMAAGADLSRVHFAVQTKVVKGDKQFERDISLEADMAAIERLLEKYPQCRWIVIDPLAGYLGGVKKNDDEPIRRILTAARELAERRGIAITTVDHFNKSVQQDAINRLSGAGSLVQVPRIVWAVIVDKDSDDHGKIMLPLKSNLLPVDQKVGRKFHTVGRDIVIENETTSLGVIAWGEKCATQIDEVLQRDADPRENRKTKATKFLREFLKDGAQPSDDVFKVGRAKGISTSAIWEAKKDGIARAYKGLGGNSWYWELDASTLSPDTE